LAWVPATRLRIASLFRWLRDPSPITRRLTASLIFILSGPVLYLLGWLGHRIMFPCWHDEGFYRLQSTFLAHGRLTMPTHLLADFFEVPWVFSHPARAVAYFPGTALLHVPGVWLHLPYYFTPVLVSSTILALLYLIVTELIDGIAGLLAVFLMVSLVMFRWLALIEMSHPAGAMWGLVALWSWLKWRKSKHIGWIALAALAAGWYAITRPLDALAVLSPLVLAWLWEIRGLGTRVWLKYAVVAILLVAPLVTLQLMFDRAVTGKYFDPPLEMFNRIYVNAKSLGLQSYDPNFVPPVNTGQMRDVYRWGDELQIESFTTVKQAATQWLTNRLPSSFGTAWPTLLLIFLYPVSILGLTDRRRWVMWLMFWTYSIAGAFFYLFNPHYVMAVAPALTFSLLLGSDVLQKTFSTRGVLAVFLPLLIFFLAIQRTAMNQQGIFVDNSVDNVIWWDSNYVPTKVTPPAIVLYQYDSKEYAALNEPVYNWDVLTPDDAPIIRAHDLGPRNVELFDYYAKLQPNRMVWRFDRRDKKLTLLGNVRDLALKQQVESRQ
jgi:hypothetical protein